MAQRSRDRQRDELNGRLGPQPRRGCRRSLQMGRGLSAEEADGVFDAFHSTKAEGMGIGLTVSRSIVEAHGGRIWAVPRPGGGAEFHFTLRGHKLGV